MHTGAGLRILSNVRNGEPVVRLIGWVLVCCGLFACSEEAAPPRAEPADLVFRGGEVVTVDPALGTTQALAVRGYRIAAVGSNEEIDRYVGPDTQVVELDGRMLMPGFIEGHGHYLSLGRARQVLDLTRAEHFGEIVGQVAAAVDGAEPGEWILGGGWHQDKWSRAEPGSVEGVPINDELSAISPDNPVFLTHASGHAAYANDVALAAAGIEDDTADPPGGTIVRDARGHATGLLREKAQVAVGAALAQYEAQQDPAARRQRFLEQVRLAGEEALRFGVTSFQDAGASFATIDAFKDLEAEGQLPVRLYVMVRGESVESMQKNLQRYYRPAVDNSYLAVRSIKRQIDGALGAHGAWLLEPYEDLPDTAGLVLEPIEEIEATARLASRYNYQLATHAIGDRGNRETLDLYERIWEEQSVHGPWLRWRIEHAQHIHPDDVPRFGALGVIAAAQGVHCTSDGPWIPSRLGVTRTETTSYRWRDLIDTGAVVGNGTDAPVESLDPLASYHASVTRIMNTGEAFHPEQAMTRLEALRSYTLDNAYAAFEEDLKGSLTPGKLADLVVLSQNILTVPDEALLDTAVDMTVVGGIIKHQRE